MAISDPAAIKYVNEKVRPISEELRALSHKVSDMLAEWNAVYASMFDGSGGTSTEGAIEDGRENEGVSRLLGEDVIDLIGEVGEVNDVFVKSGTMDVISKPCVRALVVE